MGDKKAACRIGKIVINGDLVNAPSMKERTLENDPSPRVLNKKRDKITPNAVFIGRPTKWGNPFAIGKHGDRDQVIQKYREWLAAQPVLLNSLEELRGRDLVCFCAPESCHGDVLLHLSNLPDIGESPSPPVDNRVLSRNFSLNPYTPDEQRVAEWLNRRTKGAIGAGDDPIGFLLASYEMIWLQQRVRPSLPDPDQG